MLDPQDVKSRADLVRFIEELRAGSDQFENGSLDAYLGALSGWTLDMDGYFENHGEATPDEPSWSLVAMMLLAASGYE